jgi:SAM-dependent methyltransferase
MNPAAAVPLVSSHYNEAYFGWQSALADFGAEANLWMFRDFVRATDTVVDFGCGGGFLLRRLDCRRRIGVEVNPAAVRCAHANGLEVVSDLSDLAPEFADVIISSHALEHTFDPFHKLRQAHAVLQRGGLAVFMVPCERYDRRYVADNIDQHLYTWAPLNIGNLFANAGFSVLSCERIAHRFPPAPERIQRCVGWAAFHAICRLNARLRPGITQIRTVARKA